MENQTHLYVVSFGDSDQYRISFNPEEEAAGMQSPLVKLENELNDFLKAKFPEETFAYFTTPKVVEVSAEHREQFLHYPVLDAAAVDTIKKVLVKGVEDMESMKTLNDNAPWNDVQAD